MQPRVESWHIENKQGYSGEEEEGQVRWEKVSVSPCTARDKAGSDGRTTTKHNNDSQAVLQKVVRTQRHQATENQACEGTVLRAE